MFPPIYSVSGWITIVFGSTRPNSSLATSRTPSTLSTLSILEDLWERGIPAIITDGQNRARFLCSDTVNIPRSEFTYLSVVAADREVEGVTVTGCKYPLWDATLSRRVQFAVSNEITANLATVTVGQGGVYIIESRDL